MNRLILVGNGFDLAHNMKTRYYDFILQYLRDCFEAAKTKNQFTDELIHVQRMGFSHRPVEEFTFEDYMKFRQKDESARVALAYLTGGSGNNYNETEYPYKLKVKSPFLDHLLDHCGQYNWVDIENSYYEHLTKLLESGSKTEEKLKDLNQTFAYIIVKLKQYLGILKDPGLIPDIPRIFTGKIKQDDLVVSFGDNDEAPNQTLILNFNYTETVNQYWDDPSKTLFGKNLQMIHIHGRLVDPNNPVIFGFGDELDDKYKLIENEKRPGFFNFIKSFWYFKTSNYHNLIRFITADDYQVYTLGHSCGLSDRTMLNMIFEHEKCKSIKIFPFVHNGHNNYTILTQEISRHFKDKAVMRMKIVSEDKSEPMPQLP